MPKTRTEALFSPRQCRISWALGTAALLGDPGCAESAGNMGLQLGQDGMSGCTNYTLVGNRAGDTFLNAVAGETLHLRVNNTDQVLLSEGNVDVLGTLTKPAGSFKIDHPLDPANKYLYHSFAESPDMKNMYDGNVTTDATGLATVTLPDWFETLPPIVAAICIPNSTEHQQRPELATTCRHRGASRSRRTPCLIGDVAMLRPRSSEAFRFHRAHCPAQLRCRIHRRKPLTDPWQLSFSVSAARAQLSSPGCFAQPAASKAP